MQRDDDLADALALLLGSDAEELARASPVGVDESESVDTTAAATTKRAQRREFHREVVARSRARQRERIAALVKQETALRQQLTRLLQSRRTHDVEEAQDVYAELVASQQELLASNEALEGLVHRHYLFSRLVQFERSFVVDDRDDQKLPQANKERSREVKKNVNENEAERGTWLRFLAGQPPLFYEHESGPQSAYLVSVCFHLASYLESAFEEETHLRVDEAHVLGWRAQRAIHWNDELQKKMLYFKFSRRVSSTQATLLEIQQRSWQVLSSPEVQARLYSVPVTTQLAQQIDENAQIVLQHKAYHVPVWFYSLNAQALEPRVVRQSMMVLDKPPPPEQETAQAKVVWLREGIICLSFREVGGGAVDVEFAGCMRCIDERHAQFMLIDVGCVLVRWENLVLPSRLLL